MVAVAPLWLNVLIAMASTAAIGLTAYHYFLRLRRPEQPTLDDVLFPRGWFKFVEYVRALTAWAVTGFCFYTGLDALLAWLPERLWGEPVKFVLVLLIAFYGSLLLVLGIDKLAERVRRL